MGGEKQVPRIAVGDILVEMINCFEFVSWYTFVSIVSITSGEILLHGSHYGNSHKKEKNITITIYIVQS